jgi:hypothetical protein
VRLGTGTESPWEDCTASFVSMSREQGNPHVVAAHRNLSYIVQRRQYPEHPGFDLLTVSRQHHTDDTPVDQHPGWKHLQSIKDRFAPDGMDRFGVEVFPPRRFVVDNCDLWHVWVYPLGVELGFGFHPEQEGGGLRI